MITEGEKLGFLSAIERAKNEELSEGFSVYAEGLIHKSVKLYIEPDSEKHEVDLGHAVVDILNDDGAFEVQTGSPLPLIDKIKRLLKDYKVTLVLPYRVATRHLWLDTESGEIIEPKRKTEGKKGIISVSERLYAVRELIGMAGFSVRVIGIFASETRRLDGYGKEKKIRATLIERAPLSLFSDELFVKPSDYRRLLPPGLPEKFTARELLKLAKSRSRYDRLLIKLLLHLGVIASLGKQGRAELYTVVDLNDDGV